MTNNRLILLLCVSILTFYTNADDSIHDADNDEVIVVLGKVPRPLSDVVGSATIISSEAMDAELVHNLSDLVRYQSGISIENAGTRFGQAGFSIRGISGNRVITEIDGIPVSDQFDVGSYSNSGRNFVDTDLIQQVEILRGPASSIYGSDAIGGVGFVTEIAEAALPLKWMGNIAYTVATLLKLVSLKSQKFTIELDGELLERDGVLVEIANSTFTGTTFYIAPEAEIDDGYLDVIILNKISRLKILRLFSSIYDGTHINYDEIEYIKAKNIKVTETNPGKLIPDGEIMGSTPITVECLQQDVEFLWERP